MRLSVLLFVGLVACQGEYDLKPVSTADDGSAAVRAWEDAVQGVRVEEFHFGQSQQTVVADFLFVVDNSSSMENVIDRVRKGFATLAKDNPFPAKSRIAVMGTLPGKEFDRTRPHRAARSSSKLAFDPGFLGLVDGERVARYRALMPEIADQFAVDGCDSAWFKPTDVNGAGVPCIVAHTQTGMRDVRVEAGLTALKQMLLRDGDEPLFRPGAAVNVIFVSDTHDPGANPNKQDILELVQMRPDYAELKALLEKNSTVASFRLHAIAPKSMCSENWRDIGPVYFDAVDASGGKGLDVCTADDYGQLIRDIARSGSVPTRAVFPLGKRAEDVEFVEVDGVDVPFRVSDRGDIVLLDQEIPVERASVTVHYTTAVEPVSTGRQNRKDRPRRPRGQTPSVSELPSRLK
jgi:hypothetical protein